MNDDFFERLYIEMYWQLYAMANAVLDNPDLAQDIVQETFLVACKKIDAVKNSPSPNGWLVITLRNILGNTYKKQKRLMKLMTSIAPLSDEVEAPWQNVSVYTEYEGIIDDKALWLLIQIYCNNRSYQEVADEFGITLDACKKRIQRARQQMKTALEKEEEKFKT